VQPETLSWRKLRADPGAPRGGDVSPCCHTATAGSMRTGSQGFPLLPSDPSRYPCRRPPVDSGKRLPRVSRTLRPHVPVSRPRATARSIGAIVSRSTRPDRSPAGVLTADPVLFGVHPFGIPIADPRRTRTSSVNQAVNAFPTRFDAAPKLRYLLPGENESTGSGPHRCRGVDATGPLSGGRGSSDRYSQASHRGRV
jgi:hypothetical protein